jgi:lysophospholipase L1-like esterase
MSGLRKLLVGVVALVVLVPIVVVVTGVVLRRPPAKPYVGPDNPEFTLVALGDSYISGEGAKHFYPGTDRHGSNECRRADTAHPVLVANRLQAELVFVACSGAKLADLTSTIQYRSSPPDLYGGHPQFDVLDDLSDVGVVVVSIGGNDANFGEIGLECASPFSCVGNADRWLSEVDELYGRLVRVYRRVRREAPGAAVYVVDYPNPLSPRNCGGSHLDAGEHRFIRNEFIPRLDGVIRRATVTAGVNLVEFEDVFDGARICEVDDGDGAMNTFGLGVTEGTLLSPRRWFHNSFHPNARGHVLMAARVEAAIRAGLARPDEANPEPRPDPPPTTTPSTPSPVEDDPVDQHVVPADSPCGEDAIDVVLAREVDVDSTTVRLEDAAPASLVCSRGIGEDWATTEVPPSGVVDVAVDFGSAVGPASIHDIIYESTDGSWTRIVLARPGPA